LKDGVGQIVPNPFQGSIPEGIESGRATRGIPVRF